MDPEQFALGFVRRRRGECLRHDLNHHWCARHSAYWPSGIVCHALVDLIEDCEAAVTEYKEMPEHIAVRSWPYVPTQPKEKP